MTIPTNQGEREAVLGSDLEHWLQGDQEEVRSIIVEVRLPERKVVFEPGSSAPRRFAHHLVTGDQEGRLRAIQELADYLEKKIGLQIQVLQSAGAIVALATPSQARRILLHPLTKRLSSNRTLPSRAVAG